MQVNLNKGVKDLNEISETLRMEIGEKVTRKMLKSF